MLCLCTQYTPNVGIINYFLVFIARIPCSFNRSDVLCELLTNNFNPKAYNVLFIRFENYLLTLHLIEIVVPRV